MQPETRDVTVDTTSMGKYRLIAELGQGGMAQVFLALIHGHAGFNKLVVVKQLREQFVDDPEFLAMFLDEARLAARLNHPNVVQTNEVGEANGRHFIAMEYLEGQPLNRLIQRGTKLGVLPLGLHLRIISEVLSGLQHAHELADFDGSPLGVVHRDVSPHNVFVTYSGQVKVVDFGIAKAASQSAETRSGVLKGKVSYMAPEQARGEKVDRRADLFSVGVLLWEALCERRLFKGLPDIVVLQKILVGEIPTPRSVKPDIPEVLEAVCLKALSPDREDRHATALDMQADLEAAMEAAGMRETMREAGKLVSRLFERERASITSVVEAQLSGLRATGEHPVVDVNAAAKGADARIHIPVIADPMTTTEQSASGRTGPASVGTKLTATVAEPAPARKHNKLVMPLVALGAGAAAAISYFALSATRGAGDAPATSATPTSSAKPTTHLLKLESTPAGATITEGGREVGKTPMAIAMDPAQKEARLFVVAADGYQPYTLRQEALLEDTKIVVPLTPAASAPATGTAVAVASETAAPEGPPQGKSRRPGPLAPPPATAAPAQPTSTATPLQIRVNR